MSTDSATTVSTKDQRLVTAFPSTRPDDVFGCLRSESGPKSVEQMQAGIADEAIRRHARGRY